MKNTQTNPKASVQIFTNYTDIKTNKPTTIREFDFLGSAELYADMLSRSVSFFLIRVLNHNGETYCEFEA